MTGSSKVQWTLIEQLPVEVLTVPSVIRYHDDFLDESRSIRDPAGTEIWTVSVYGTTERWDFRVFPPPIRDLMKHFFSVQLQTMAAGTAAARFERLRRIELHDLVTISSSSPSAIRATWHLLTAKYDRPLYMDSLKSLLRHMCQFRLLAWSPEYTEFLFTLPLPAVDKLPSVRTGESFLAVDEEAALVAYFDDLTQTIRQHTRDVSDTELRDAAVLVCSFQFGLRPMQIGMLKMCDVRIWNELNEPDPSVHLTFRMIKQRSRSAALPMVRKVKREWSWLFVELYARSVQRGIQGSDRIFGVSSARAIATVIRNATARLLPVGRCATDLRHTAAQRLVDAGASQEELAEFMGHSDIDTGLVYFQTSPTQAERVNRAMGISSIYRQVAKIAHERFISAEELASLKEDQQIGAVPHGIPIAGIGACSIGQPACPSNPATACYGCFKFMPINNPEIHRHVLADFRSVVALFSEASKNDEKSPAYVQLKRTISNVLSIISELEGSEHE
ncbi:MAG: site-specific integrase [Rhodocyclales bacterium]|nr:site-specific integrase [Rhodocyclales bacterium]